MADPSMGDIPAGVGGAGAVGLLWGLKAMYDSWRARQTGASEDRARDVATDLSLAGGWREYGERMEARVAKLEEDRDGYVQDRAKWVQDRAAWLSEKNQLEAELVAARSRIAHLEARVAELERASASPGTGSTA